MPPPPLRDPRPAQGVLLVGPGPRAGELASLLAVLGAAQGVEVRAFSDLAELALEAGRGGLLVLDVDATPLEDVGYVRRFLAAHAGLDVVLLGSDPRSRTARMLGRRSFAHWPPDVEELAALLASARAASAPGPAGAGARSSAVHGTTTGSAPSTPSAPATRLERAVSAAEDNELEQVRAILEAGPGPAVPVSVPADEPLDGARGVRVVDLDGLAGEDHADFETLHDGLALEASAQARTLDHARAGDRLPAEAPAREEVETDAPRSVIDVPPWWRAQVADLADSAQRIDLSVKMLAEAAPEIDEGDLDEARTRLRELEGEVARLLQFTRTLGYVAAPPPAGSQTFDLGEIVHLFASGLAQSGPEAPRCQFKAAPGATVRSDRQLLSQALDAVFFLVRCTSRKGDLVRAQVLREDGAKGAWVELALDFPSGPLEGLGEDEVVSPYGLSDLFPELGPNALAAASGIVAGQGGRLTLVNRARGRMTWHLRLPRAGG